MTLKTSNYLWMNPSIYSSQRKNVANFDRAFVRLNYAAKRNFLTSYNATFSLEIFLPQNATDFFAGVLPPVQTKGLVKKYRKGVGGGGLGVWAGALCLIM